MTLEKINYILLNKIHKVAGLVYYYSTIIFVL